KHRLEGNQEDFDNTLKRIEQWAVGQDQVFLTQHAFEVLLLNDAIEKFFEIVPKSAAGFLFDIHTGRWDMEPAFVALGIEQFRPPFNEWSDEVKLQLRQGNSAALLPALEFAQYIEGMGEKEEARRIFTELGEACLD